MSFSELIQKVKDLLKEDEPEPETESELKPQLGTEKYSFRDSFQGRMMEIVIGYALTLLIMTAIVPDMLTRAFEIVNNELTFSFIFTLSLVGYLSIMCFQTMGSFILDHVFLVWNDIKEHVGLPKIVSDSLIVIVLVGYLVFKLMYPTAPDVAR